VPEYAYAAAINERTNKIYVTGGEGMDGLVTVIDGKTDTVLKTIAAGNPATPKDCQEVDLYSCSNWGSYLFALAVNPETNKIYVPAVFEGRVIVIDGNTDMVINSIPVEYGPAQVAINTERNTVYVSNRNSASLSVIDGRHDDLLGSILVGTPTSPVNCYLSLPTPECNTVSIGSWTWTVGINNRTGKIYFPKPADGQLAIFDNLHSDNDIKNNQQH
jgi:YVTN family beta-propeller protein